MLLGVGVVGGGGEQIFHYSLQIVNLGNDVIQMW